MATTLSIDRAALEQLTRLAPPYIYEILVDAKMDLLYEAGTGFVFQIQTTRRNQLLLLLLEESVIATLKAITQLFQPDILRLSHRQLQRDIPVQDFLSFCG